MTGADVRVGNYRYLLNQQTIIMKGTVKWFNKKKGYGFISGIQAVLTYGQRYVKDSKVTPTRVTITLN